MSCGSAPLFRRASAANEEPVTFEWLLLSMCSLFRRASARTPGGGSGGGGGAAVGGGFALTACRDWP